MKVDFNPLETWVPDPHGKTSLAEEKHLPPRLKTSVPEGFRAAGNLIPLLSPTDLV